jgi:hypothetical protein
VRKYEGRKTCREVRWKWRRSSFRLFLLENIEKKYREEGRSSQISRQKLVIAAIFFARKTETII